MHYLKKYAEVQLLCSRDLTLDTNSVQTWASCKPRCFMLAKEKKTSRTTKRRFQLQDFFAVQKGTEMQVKHSSQDPNL